jgi:hypothetical protein
MSETVRFEILLGWVCARCGHQGGHNDSYTAHRYGGACKLKPACFIEVDTEAARAEAITHAMRFGHSREHAEAIVKLKEKAA